MDWDKLQTISYFFFSGVVLVLGLGLGVPYYHALQEIRADEIKFFSSPVYCKIQEKLCNGTTYHDNVTPPLYTGPPIIINLSCPGNESWRYSDGGIPTPDELASGAYYWKKLNISVSIR